MDDTKKIQCILKFIEKLNIDEVRIRTEKMEIYVKKNIYKKILYHLSHQHNDEDHYLKSQYKKKNIDKQYLTIKSPMIGTFYRKSHPDKEPFVKIGDNIKIGQKLCVIESMKLFNDIESEFNGKLIKIFVEDANPVDYDQPLFLLDPND
ncbi:acetyl-CoA carboxylase biotin carboxyl carrier protein [Blattabacterium cuenoti]|uniref:acetyl-CoA carboxylase biotin carboxyl carrier protein n=1 Tax=Blattabacterium cuenoti TaxID=1653831 RepID=UPI00163C219F|nr:acetyl-CoA carboxylase biotin carboxyl carrier protein [Blattabacterium cuenoti]